MEIRGLLHNPRFRTIALCFGVFTGLFILVNITLPGGDLFFQLSNTLLSPAAALLACFLYIRGQMSRQDPASKTFWLGMAWGYGLWALADMVWAFYTLALNQPIPYPSAADLIFGAGYIAFYYALITRTKTLKIHPTTGQKWITAVISLAWLLLVSVLVLQPILSQFDPERWLEGVVSILYPLGDMVLILLVSLLLILLQEGRFALSWRLIFSGILLSSISDLIFSFATWQNIYLPDGHVNAITILTDTTYTLAYLSAAFGAVVYHLIWEIKESFAMDIGTMPADRYYAFLSTNAQNRIITVSNNFHVLVKAGDDHPFHKMPLHEAIGISPSALQPLIERIKASDILRNEPFTITTLDLSPREVWITGMAFYDPERRYSGVNIAITADLNGLPAELRLPQNHEILGMLNHLISLAGSHPKDEIQTIQVYFCDIIRLLSSMLYQFGGPQFHQALLDQLGQTVQQKNLQVKINRQTILFSEVHEGQELAFSLIPLLGTARRFATDLLGEQLVCDEISEFEKQLTPTILRDLDKYHLRIF